MVLLHLASLKANDLILARRMTNCKKDMGEKKGRGDIGLCAVSLE